MLRVPAVWLFLMHFCALLAAGPRDGRMLSLKLLQLRGTITVLEAVVVPGAPRERFPASGPRWEMITAAGLISGQGMLPAPIPLSWDVPDSTGALSGGTLPADSIEWFVRVPYTPDDERIDFYEALSEGGGTSPAPAASRAPVGSCLLREVLP